MPEVRVRFTSPHPKDFPDEVLEAIADFPNICRQLHLPAQSGNSDVLVSFESCPVSAVIAKTRERRSVLVGIR